LGVGSPSRGGPRRWAGGCTAAPGKCAGSACACGESCVRPWLVANRATLRQKWPPPPWSVAGSCEWTQHRCPWKVCWQRLCLPLACFSYSYHAVQSCLPVDFTRCYNSFTQFLLRDSRAAAPLNTASPFPRRLGSAQSFFSRGCIAAPEVCAGSACACHTTRQ
jgi:hypothetical protein